MQNQFTITYVLSVVLWVGVIALVRRAWSGLMDEERERIVGFGLGVRIA